MQDLSGERFGAYRLVAPLGAVGGTTVYQAHQSVMDLHVALTILSPQVTCDRRLAGCFYQEFTAIVSLRHPHILPVLDFGETDGYTYIAMPLVAGATLAERLTGAPLSLDAARRVIDQIGGALDCAHWSGLTHRDVRPTNILLDEQRNCLLTGFGIARILEGMTGAAGTGRVPAYRSPEQSLGTSVDWRSDIYALGVLLYEMVTGRLPIQPDGPPRFVPETVTELVPSPRAVNSTLPEAVEQVILKALAPQPGDRYQSAAELVHAVRAMPQGQVTISSDETTERGRLAEPLPAALEPEEALAPRPPGRESREGERRSSNVRWAFTVAVAAALVVAVAVPVWRFVPRTVASVPPARASAPAAAVDPPATVRATPRLTGAATGSPAAGVLPEAQPAVAGDALPEGWAAKDPPSPDGDPIEEDSRSRAAAVVAAAQPDGGGTPAEDGSVSASGPVKGLDETRAPPVSLATAPDPPAPRPGALLIQVDAASTVTLDGELVGAFHAGELRRVPVSLGRHRVSSTARAGLAQHQVVVEVTDSSPQAVRLQLQAAAADLREVARSVVQQLPVRNQSSGNAGVPTAPQPGSGMPPPGGVSGALTTALGRADAPLTLVEFIDFQCPYCTWFATTTFHELKAAYIDTGKLRLISRDLPLESHDDAMRAANAARCAGEQRKYWEMRDIMFRNNAELSHDALLGYARDLELHMSRFETCLTNYEYEADVREDVAYAVAIGIVGTPSFVLGKTSGDPLDGTVIVGAQPFTVFDAEIKALFGEGP